MQNKNLKKIKKIIHLQKSLKLQNNNQLKNSLHSIKIKKKIKSNLKIKKEVLINIWKTNRINKKIIKKKFHKIDLVYFLNLLIKNSKYQVF